MRRRIPRRCEKLYSKKRGLVTFCESSYCMEIVLKGVRMKRLCKHVDITDISFIKESIRECLKNKNKRRKDIKKLLNKYQTIDDLAYTIQK